MNIHSEILIFELISLYYNFMSAQTNEKNLNLNIDDLEDAFYLSLATLKDLNPNFDPNTYNFYPALEEVVSASNDIFIIKDNTLIINEDPSLSETKNFEEASEADFYLIDNLANMTVFSALKIPIPLKKYQDLFNLNREIVKQYNELTKLEIMHQDLSETLTFISKLAHELYEKFTTLKIEDYYNLLLCCTYLNSLNLASGDNMFLNTPWQIIFFPKQLSQIASLTYEQIQNFTNSFFNDDDDDKKDAYLGEFEPYLFSQILFLNLNSYLTKLEDGPLLSALILKKNRLLATSNLSDIASYLSKNKSLKNYQIDPYLLSMREESHFHYYLSTILKCCDFTKYTDTYLEKNPLAQTNLIINIIFIKSFLDLSLNQEDCNEIITTLKTAPFYQNEAYSILNEELSAKISYLRPLERK